MTTIRKANKQGTTRLWNRLGVNRFGRAAQLRYQKWVKERFGSAEVDPMTAAYARTSERTDEFGQAFFPDLPERTTHG